MTGTIINEFSVRPELVRRAIAQHRTWIEQQLGVSLSDVATFGDTQGSRYLTSPLSSGCRTASLPLKSHSPTASAAPEASFKRPYRLSVVIYTASRSPQVRTLFILQQRIDTVNQGNCIWN
jgi:hypothetical protein